MRTTGRPQPTIEHVAGPQRADGTQVCTRCAALLVEDRRDLKPIVSYERSIPAGPNGWPEGPIYVIGPWASTEYIGFLPETPCAPPETS